MFCTKVKNARYKVNYDKKSRNKKLDVGDQVLILLPIDNNKLLKHWKGPFEVVEKFGSCDFKTNVNGKIKIYHANLLKSYINRQATVTGASSSV